MADDDYDEIDYMQEDEAMTYTIIRPDIGSYHLFVIIFSLMIYAKIFCKLLSDNKDQLFTGLFAQIYLSQGLMDVLFLFLCIVFDLPRFFPATWPFFYAFNGTFWVVFLELFSSWVFVSETINVAFLAVERFTAKFALLEPVHNVLTQIPSIVIILVKFIIPMIPLRVFIGIRPPFFAFADQQSLVALFTMHHGTLQTDYVGPYIMVACALTLLCTVCIGIKLLKNCGSNEITDDMRRTIFGMLMVIPQLVSGGFAAAGQKAKDDADLDRATFLVGQLANVQLFFIVFGPAVIFIFGRSRSALFSSKPSTVSVTG